MNQITLVTGVNIPLRSAGAHLRQPLVRDVAVIGEENFFIGVNFLKFNRESLGDLGEMNDATDFQIFSTIMASGQKSLNVIAAELIMMLMFEGCIKINAEPGMIELLFEDDRCVIMNESVFKEFRDIVNGLYAFTKGDSEDYVPENSAAAKIAEKLRAGRARVAALNGDNVENAPVSIVARYISVLSIALNIELTKFLDYTVSQVFDNFKRFELHNAYDINIRSRLAGAKDMDDPENWLKDLAD